MRARAILIAPEGQPWLEAYEQTMSQALHPVMALAQPSEASDFWPPAGWPAQSRQDRLQRPVEVAPMHRLGHRWHDIVVGLSASRGRGFTAPIPAFACTLLQMGREHPGHRVGDDEVAGHPPAGGRYQGW